MTDGSVGRRAWLLALGLILCVSLFTGTASATVFVASADDVGGDAMTDNNPQLSNPAIDFTRVAVRYDDQLGRVDVQYVFNRAPLSTQQVYAGVSLGTVLPDGSCNAPFFISLGWHAESNQQQALVEGVWNGDILVNGTGVFGELFNAQPPTTWFDSLTKLSDWQSEPAKTWNFATANASLKGKTYNCAGAATFVADSGFSVDYPSTGPLILRRESNGPPTSSTAIAWVSPHDGATISGALTEGGAGPLNCLAAVQGPVDHTINYVDGHAHDTQVNPPWSCEWDTHDVANGAHTLTVVAFDAGGRELARDTVSVVVANPDPPTNPPPPGQPTQEPGTGAVGDVCTRFAGACQPIVVITPPAAPPSIVVTNTTTSTNTNIQKTKIVLVISKKAANGAADKALLARAGRAFKHRTRYKRACTASNKTGSKWACTASWRQGGKGYTGTVKLSRRNGRTVAKATVHRRVAR